MGIKDMVEKMWCEELIYNEVIDTNWTNTQLEQKEEIDYVEWI